MRTSPFSVRGSVGCLGKERYKFRDLYRDLCQALILPGWFIRNSFRFSFAFQPSELALQVRTSESGTLTKLR